MPVIKKGAWLYNEIVEVANASNGSTGTECIHYKDVFFSEYNEKYQILKYLTKFEMKKKKTLIQQQYYWGNSMHAVKQSKSAKGERKKRAQVIFKFRKLLGWNQREQKRTQR